MEALSDPVQSPTKLARKKPAMEKEKRETSRTMPNQLCPPSLSKKKPCGVPSRCGSDTQPQPEDPYPSTTLTRTIISVSHKVNALKPLKRARLVDGDGTQVGRYFQQPLSLAQLPCVSVSDLRLFSMLVETTRPARYGAWGPRSLGKTRPIVGSTVP